MNRWSTLAVAGIVAFAALQLVRPNIPTKPATAELQVPHEVHQILERDCYSCHSDQRRLAWFDEVVPAYWLVRHDILEARGHVNFSTLGARPAAAQKATLYEAVSFMQLGAMPLPQFTALHPEAKVTPEDLATLKAYLNPWGTAAPGAAATAPETAASPVDLSSIAPEFNGLAFDPAFESWKVISTTERGDNNTFRFVLGNDTAQKAAAAGNITPWPDGSRFAKVTWQRETRSDGLVYPGKFVQVELMVKDAKRYKNTEGWGWGRWRGLDLKPYGTSVAFVGECTSCHQPMKANDYVYTLPITQAKLGRPDVVNNAAAALPESRPYQPLGWHPITLFVDPKTKTTSTLYGNDEAVQSTNFRAGATAPTHYKGGSILALVTWGQREDPHWFGARIPGAVQSLELVSVDAAGSPSYRTFNDVGELKPDPGQGTRYMQRMEMILRLAPVRMP